MKVLSLMQPWATLVVMGLKTIETRSWATDYRGPLFIHASKSRAGKTILPALGVPIPDFNALPFGAIIGEVNLDKIVRFEELDISKEDWERQALEGKAFGDYKGKFCWMFKDAVVLEEPITATGRLGLWEF
jgi:hypothetical protein